jgi:hypothetical protein
LVLLNKKVRTEGEAPSAKPHPMAPLSIRPQNSGRTVPRNTHPKPLHLDQERPRRSSNPSGGF